MNTSIIKNPRITEKATMLVEESCYTFDVAKGTTKSEIIKAIKALYKVLKGISGTLLWGF